MNDGKTKVYKAKENQQTENKRAAPSHGSQNHRTVTQKDTSKDQQRAKQVYQRKDNKPEILENGAITEKKDVAHTVDNPDQLEQDLAYWMAKVSSPSSF